MMLSKHKQFVAFEIDAFGFNAWFRSVVQALAWRALRRNQVSRVVQKWILQRENMSLLWTKSRKGERC